MKPFKAWAVVEQGRIACWNYRVPLYWLKKYAAQDAEGEGLNTKIVRVKVSVMRGEEMNSYSTAWWGTPGLTTATKTHIAFNGSPLCGVKLGKGRQEQFCAIGVRLSLVECNRCLRKYSGAKGKK